jgi:hypothetical protein
MKFIFFVLLINYQLKHVKILLEEIFKRKNFIEEFRKAQKMRKFELLKPPETQLKNVIKMYNIVYENCLLINNSIGISLLSLIFLFVLFQINNGYKFFLAILGSFPIERLGGSIQSFLNTTIALIAMVNFCNETSKIVSCGH